jgi:hypothetical protein
VSFGQLSRSYKDEKRRKFEN